jgi:hypothetical protein
MARSSPEIPAHFRALARHGLQQQRGMHGRIDDLVQDLPDEHNAGLAALAQVVARVHVVIVAGQGLHFAQVVGQCLTGELPHMGFAGAGIQGIGSMGHQGDGPVGCPQFPKGGHVGRIGLPGLAAPGIAGEKGKGIRPDAERGPPHGRKPLAAGQVTSDM